MQIITKKQFLKYTLLPDVRSRFGALFASGFQYIPYLLALVYQAVRLIPNNHAYLRSENIGKYGVRHVIGQAANNLVISKQNIDQVILFFVILVGMGLLALQILLLLLTAASFMIPSAAASGSSMMPNNFAGFFSTPYPQQDLAFMFMDLVFGVEGIFDSCVSTAVNCIDGLGNEMGGGGYNWVVEGVGWPMPIHHAMHALFQFYSIGILVVAGVIISYFIATVLLETAQSGTPFGKRFNRVWAPLRIVVAIGLLIPTGHGLNSAQYIVLYAAKYGSGFATNGWKIFTDTLDIENNVTGAALNDTDNQHLISEPTLPEFGGFMQFLYTAAVCRDVENMANGVNDFWDDDSVKLWAVRDSSSLTNALNVDDYGLTGYDALLEFARGNQKVELVFGIRDENKYRKYKGDVYPVCGTMIFPLADPRNGSGDMAPEPGPEMLQRFYLYMLGDLFYFIFSEDQNLEMGFDPGANIIGRDNTFVNYPQWSYWTARKFTSFNAGNGWTDDIPAFPPAEGRKAFEERYKDKLHKVLINPIPTSFPADVFNFTPRDGGGYKGALQLQMESDTWQFDPVLRDKGWAGAGIWYNKLAQINGLMNTAVNGLPHAKRFPLVMEKVLNKKRGANEKIPVDQAYQPILPGGKDMKFTKPEDKEKAKALWQAFNYWQSGGSTSSSQTQETGNVFMDTINALFGTEGLYSMRRNRDVHPMAQLVGVGKSLIHSAIRNLGVSVEITAANNITGKTDPIAGGASAYIGFSLSITMIALTIGFILFYIVPFLPFIYFFFAVGGWVKGIFEAMIGVPLWALAHIRIDGEGLFGPAAGNGYYLIFEVFIRPILIIFGLLASVLIFSALVSVLNDTWDIVTSNLSGFDVKTEATGQITTAIGEEDTANALIEFFRGPVDEFFFTVIYTVIVYMMGMSCFKLIDLIPNNILRWMGQSISTFNDENEDAAKSMMGSAAVGSQQAIDAIGGGLKGVAKSANTPAPPKAG